MKYLIYENIDFVYIVRSYRDRPIKLERGSGRKNRKERDVCIV